MCTAPQSIYEITFLFYHDTKNFVKFNDLGKHTKRGFFPLLISAWLLGIIIMLH